MRALVLLLAACGGSTTTTTTKPEPKPDGSGLVAWETIRGVFQHPRCQNCHPGGDAPLIGDAGQIHGQNVLRGSSGDGMVGEECTTCHGPANPPSAFGAHIPPGSPKRWHMPGPDQKLVFVGVASGDLCRQIQDPAKNGGRDMASLRAHLDDPLVTWGWAPGFGRAPIPTSREAFLAAWETWAHAGAPCPN